VYRGVQSADHAGAILSRNPPGGALIRGGFVDDGSVFRRKLVGNREYNLTRHVEQTPKDAAQLDRNPAIARNQPDQH
jgi:hypothetical protein